jgi:hypothetical protein
MSSSESMTPQGHLNCRKYTLKFDKTQEFSQIIEKFFNIAFSSHMRILLYKKTYV